MRRQPRDPKLVPGLLFLFCRLAIEITCDSSCRFETLGSDIFGKCDPANAFRKIKNVNDSYPGPKK